MRTATAVLTLTQKHRPVTLLEINGGGSECSANIKLKQRHYPKPGLVVLLWRRVSGCITGIIIFCQVGVRSEINRLADQRIAGQERSVDRLCSASRDIWKGERLPQHQFPPPVFQGNSFLPPPAV
jgi:hypothetical protein